MRQSPRSSTILPVIFLAILLVLCGCGDRWHTLSYKASKAPADNPLKGFMPYAGEYDFPHSLEYFYVGMAEIVKGPGEYDWGTKVDSLLDVIAGRGHQAVFRVYLDYPRRPVQVPEYLLQQGVGVTDYTDHGGGKSPDYNNPVLVDAIVELIYAMGDRYDGDPRIGFIQVGMLGHWGEFHTWPVDSLFASADVQNRVLDAYETAFEVTHCLVSQDIFAHAPMARIRGRRIGLHDDVFTRETHLKGDEHFFKRLTVHGMTDHWRTVPIGGEITPGQQSCIWDPESCTPDDYYECIRDLHPTFLLNHRPFVSDWDEDKVQRALAGTRALGYEFHIPAIKIKRVKGQIRLTVRMENTGVAPFYYEWPIQVAMLKGKAEIVYLQDTDWDIRQVLPGEPALEFECLIPRENMSRGVYRSGIRILNPNPHGPPVRFANAQQTDEWLYF